MSHSVPVAHTRVIPALSSSFPVCLVAQEAEIQKIGALERSREGYIFLHQKKCFDVFIVIKEKINRITNRGDDLLK